MSDLQYDSSQNEFGRPPVQEKGVDITGKIVQWGLASNRQQAEYVLIGVGVVALIVTYFVYTHS